MEVDERLRWLETRVTSSVRPRNDDLKALFANDDNRHAFLEFCNNEDVRRVFVFTKPPKHTLCASLNPPHEIRSKAMFFLKTNQASKLTKDNIREDVVYSDCDTLALQQLDLLAKEIYLPLLCTDGAQTYSGVSADKLMDVLHRLMGTLEVTEGHVEGKITLPLPSIEVLAEAAALPTRRAAVIHVLESSVIGWIKQIRFVLKHDPMAELQRRFGNRPGPMDEVQMWQDRAEQLHSINQQLDSPIAADILMNLDEANSTYSQSFHNVRKDIAKALMETNENLKFLSTLLPWFEQLHDATRPAEMLCLFSPVIQTMTLVWLHSRYYHQESKFNNLLRLVSNEVVARAESMVGQDVVQNPLQSHTRLKDALRICAAFRGTYLDFKDKADAINSQRNSETEEAMTLNPPKGVLYSTKLYGISSKRKTDLLSGTTKEATVSDMTAILKEDEWTDSPWPPRNAPCFDVMNSFMERCNDVLELVQTVRHFHLLETTAEVGGAGTKSLDSLVREIHEEFDSAMNEFSDKVGEDVLDISDGQAFEKAFFAFRSVVKDLEKRLAIVLRQSFLQCPTIGAQLRLLEVFEGVSGREMVQENLKDKDRHLINSLTAELISVKSMFHATMRKPPLHSNMPPVVSNLIWIRALKARVQEPMEKLRRISPQSLDGDTGWHVRDIFADCIDDFQKYEQKIVRDWQNNIVTELKDRLKQPLLVADDYDEEQDVRPQVINVNLDPELYLLLREVHYLAQEPYNVKIPDDVRTLLRNTDASTLRTTAARLETIVAKYNTVMRTITDFERPLFERKLGKIDHLFEQGLTHYTWKMTESADFIELAHSLVCADLHHNLSIVQSNCQEMIDISESWSKLPLDVFEVREHDKSYSMDSLIELQKILDEEHQSYVTPSGNKIHQLLLSSFEAVEISRASPAWEEYVAHMDALVLNGLKQTTVKSLRSMLNTIVHSNMAEKQGTITPILTIRMELIENFVSFTPPLDQSTAVVSVQERVMQWLSAFRARGSLVRMLGADDKHGYEEYITMDEDVHQFTQQILMMVKENGEECKELLKLFTNYTFLWLQDISATFEEFLHGRLTPNPRRNPSNLDAAAGMREIASARSIKSAHSDRSQTQGSHVNMYGASTASNSIGASGLMGTAERSFLTPKKSREHNINVPTLDMFDAEVDIYKTARDEIANLQDCQDVGWLRVDLMPIKQVLTTYASRWMWTFTKYLSDQVTDLLLDLDSFLKHIEPEIESITGEERDTASFMKMMRLFNEVSAKQQEMDGKFTAMNRTVLLIKKYKQELPESTQQLFDAAPGRWNNLKTKVSLAKQRLGPRIQEEADRITKDLAAFGERVDTFNQRLCASEIYTRECSIEQAYELITDYTNRLDELDSEAQDLIELQELLETAVVNFTIIPECRHELKNLKQVWETVRLVEEQQNEWKRERWQKMNTKYLREATNDQLDMINSLSEEVQLWDVYLGMQDSILIIQACLPLIDDLSNPAMRPRHWKQLVRVIGVILQIDNDSLNRMTLGQLLQLGLHNHVDEVRSIVQRAVKDVAIESALKTYEEIWLSKIFELRPHVRSATVTVEEQPAEDTATKSEMSDADVDKDKSRANVSRRTQSRMSSVTGGQSRNRRTSVSSLPASLLNLGDDSGVLFLLHDTEPVFEELESHQVSLQAMQNSSVAGSFLDEVIKWQKRLQTIEAVLSVWLDVQEKWVELEEVFSGPDVRTTLSQEAKLFSSANRDFRLLMRATEKNPNVLQCCQRKGILVAMEKMNSHLEQCWKSLLHHLERRRQKFPRFYFLSLEDVLHIICNGYDVGQANLYLPKLFENLGKLEYEETATEANDRGLQIISVISKMGEKLPLKKVVPSDGQVESWLTVLLQTIKASLQQQLASALGHDMTDVTTTGRPEREIHSAGARRVTITKEERKGSSRAGSRVGSRKSKRAGSKTPGEESTSKEQTSQKSWILDHVTEVVYMATQMDMTSQTERCLKAVDGGEHDAVQETIAKVNKSIEAAVVMLKGLEDEKERRARQEKLKKESDSISTKEDSIHAKEDSRSLSETISQTGRHSSQQSYKGSHLSLTEQPPVIAEEGSVITEQTEPPTNEPKTPEAVDTMKVVLPPGRPKVKVEVEEAIDKTELKLMLFPSQIQKISNLIALLAHQRDVMRRLLQQLDGGAVKNSLLESFDWKSQLKYQWIESNMSVNVKIMDSEFDYGYEYMGSTDRAVMTPMTERAIVSLTQAVKGCMAGLCVGPMTCDSREVIKELSVSLGKPVYMFNCSKTLDSFMLSDIFKGLAATGAWICFSNINYIKPDVLSVCAQLLQNTLDSLRAGKTTISIQSDDVALNSQGVCFATMDNAINVACNDPERHLMFNSSVAKLPPNLIQSFRVISVSNPDIRTTLEVMLLSQGFLSATELSGKLVALQELATKLLPVMPAVTKENNYNPTACQGWSIQTLRLIIQEAGSTLDEMLSISVAESFTVDTVRSQEYLAESTKQPAEVVSHSDLPDQHLEPTGEQPAADTEKTTEAILPPDEKKFENEALVLALRDSSMPKLHGQDADMFIRILQDLFPDVDVPLDFGGNTDRTESFTGMKLNTPVVNPSAAAGTQAFTPIGSHEKQPLEDINEAIAVATTELSLMPGVVFQARVSQFASLTNIHQCVLVVGPAGCGKSECINTYVAAQREMGKTVGIQRIFTRAVESEELLGYTDPISKEWKDGLFQTLIRKHCLHSNTDFINSKPLVKVVHMDGEVDAQQMEVLGSVFSSNNTDVLVMGNNERIHLPDSVRVFWEMESLAHVSPAILSNVGIISMDKSDVGWQLIIAKWLASRPDPEQEVLKSLIDVYVETSLDFLESCTRPAIMGKSQQPRMKKCIDTSDMNLVSTLCSLMEALISQQSDLDDLQYERYFNFACIWAFGGILEEKHKSAFSHWWRHQWSKRIDYPQDGEVWDYLIDSETNEFIHWQDAVPVYSMPPHEGIPDDAFVHTVAIEQLSYLLGLLSDAGKPVMLVGENGCGKTSIVNDRIRTVCSGEVAEVLALTVHANRFTTARLLWQRLNERLEWKHGRTYVPKGNKKLMFLVDDLNLGKVDSSGSQSACEMVRQHIDCGGVYDPDKRAWRTVKNVTYVTTLNPKISASVPKASQRLLRHFAVFRCPYPSANETHTIFTTLLNTHFLTPHTSSATGIREKILHSEFKEEEQLRQLLSVVVKVTIEVQDKMRSMFLPTAERCHYIFSLRDMMAVFRNICLSLKPRCRKEDLLLLWRHECQWIYGERCVNSVDADRYQLAFVTAARKLFTNEELLQTVVSTDQPLFSNLVEQDSGIVMAGVYRPSSGSTVGNEEDTTDQYQPCWQEEKLRFLVEHALEEYNKTHPRMKLALYKETIERVCRIARCIHSPHSVGHQLLVAEGCPGLASIMTKLAANLCGYTVFNINPSPVTSSVDYKMDQFKSDLVSAYTKTAVKAEKILLLLNEDELLDEDFLIYVGEFIENGSITHLFSSEEQTTIINSIRTEVTAAGLTYTREVAWNYFLKTVRNNFRVVLTSSTGSTAFQRRCREYPTVTSHLRCLWFPHWSKEKLVLHASYHLKDLPNMTYIQKENLAHLLATIHIAIRQLDGRERDAGSYNHLTNTSYEKFIERFISIAKERDDMIENEHAIMTQALQHIDKENELALRLKKQLEHEKVVLEERKEGTVKLLSQIGQDTAIAEQQVKIVRKQEDKIESLRKALPRYQIAHERAIFKASRIVKDTKQVVETLDTTSLAELRSMQKPDVDIEDLMGAIIMILKSPSADLTWSKGAKRQMANMDRFIDELMGFDENQLPEPTLNLVEPYLKKTSFIPENMVRKTNNGATGSLCKWLRGVIRYHRLMISKVKPLHSKVEETAAAVEDAEHKLSTLQSKRKALEDRLYDLAKGFEEGTVDKNDQDEKTRKMDQQLETAAKFRQILATEHEHCLQIYESLPRRKAAIPGSAAIAAAFATYLGPYDHNFRRAMLTIHWPLCLRERGVPLVIDSIDPMKGRIVDWAIDGGRSMGLNAGEPSFVIIEEDEAESGIEDDDEEKEVKESSNDNDKHDDGEEPDKDAENVNADETVEAIKEESGNNDGVVMETEFANIPDEANVMESASELSESRYAYTADTLPNITPQEYTQYTRALVKIMVGDKVLQEWITKGLSPREIENASILQTSWQRPPLLIDPYLQGVKWMRRSVKRRNKLINVDMQTRFDPSIIVQIEKAILGGYPVLLMNCEPHVDSMVTPLIHHRNTANEKDEKEALLANFDNYVDGLINSIMQARTQTNTKEKERNKDEEPRMIRYSSRRLLCHENFRLYMQTSNGNALFNPEVSSTSTLIGYTTSAETLQDELLSRAFARVRPTLYMERMKVLKAVHQHRKTLYDLENLLIEKLKGEKTDIWEQTEYVSAIVDAKEHVAGKLAEAQQILGALDQLQDELLPVAKRAALLFSVLRSLEGIQHEYIFSLPFFIALFDKAVGEDPPPEEEEEESDDDGESTTEDEVHAMMARPVSVSTKCSDDQTNAEDQEKKDEDNYADEKFDDDDNAGGGGDEGGGNEVRRQSEVTKPAEMNIPESPQLPTEGVDYNNMSANQVKQILDSLTQTVFQSVRQSLYEEHRLLFASMLCLNIQNESSDLFQEEEMALLLQGNPGFGNMVLTLADFDCDEPVPNWLPSDKWDDVIAMSVLPGPLDSLCVQVAENSDEWEGWYRTDMPENEPLPVKSDEPKEEEYPSNDDEGAMTNASPDLGPMTDFHQLLILRMLRPDRLPTAMATYVNKHMTSVKCITPSLSSILDSSRTLLGVLVLMPPDPESSHFTSSITLKVNPVDVLKQLAQLKNIPIEVVNIAEGSEAEIDIVIDMAVKNDGWVVLQDLHLATPAFSRELKHHLIRVGNTGGPMGLNLIDNENPSNFCVWITSQPSEDISVALLQSLRVVNWDTISGALLQDINNEATDGNDCEFKANTLQDILKTAIVSALDAVPESQWNSISEQASTVKDTIFGICVIHGILVARQSYGCRGLSQWYTLSPVQIQQAIETVIGPIKTEGSSENRLEDISDILSKLVYGNLIQNEWDKVYLETIVEHVMSAISGQSGNLLLGSVSIGIPPANVDPPRYSEWLAEKWSNTGNSTQALSLDSSVEKYYNQTNGIDFLKYLDKIYELQHSGPHDRRVRLHMKKDIDTYRLQHAMDLVMEQLPSMLELGKMPEQILNQGYSFPYHVPSVVSLASIHADEMPESLGYVLLQECHWMNALLCHIRQSLYELDIYVLGGEHAIPQQFTETSKSLQEELVPISWVHPLSQPTTHTLLSWLKDLHKRHQQLKQWIKESKVPTYNPKQDVPRGELTSVWLGGLVNPESLITAVRQEKAVLLGCLLAEVTLECDVSTSMDRDTFEIEHEGGMYLHGLYLQGASWDMQNSCLSAPKTELNGMPSVYIRPVSKQTANDQQHQEEEEATYFECPVFVNKSRQISAFTLPLKCPTPVEQWKQSGTAIILDAGAPEDSAKKSKGFTAIKREVAMIEDDVLSERIPSSIGTHKSDSASEHSRISRRSARSHLSRMSNRAQQHQQQQNEKHDSTWSVRSSIQGKDRYSFSMFDYRAPTLREKQIEERQKRLKQTLENENQNNNLDGTEISKEDDETDKSHDLKEKDILSKDETASRSSRSSYRSEEKRALSEPLFESEASRSDRRKSDADSLQDHLSSKHADKDDTVSARSYSAISGKNSQASFRSNKSADAQSIHDSKQSDAEEDGKGRSSEMERPSSEGQNDARSSVTSRRSSTKSITSPSPHIDKDGSEKSIKSLRNDDNDDKMSNEDFGDDENESITDNENKKSQISLKEDRKSQISLKEDRKSQISLKEDRKSQISLKEDRKSQISLKEDRKSQISLKEDRKSRSSIREDNDGVSQVSVQASAFKEEPEDISKSKTSLTHDAEENDQKTVLQGDAKSQNFEKPNDDEESEPVSKSPTTDKHDQHDVGESAKRYSQTNVKVDDDGKAEDDKVSTDGEKKHEEDYDYDDDFSVTSDDEKKDKKAASDEDDFFFDSSAKAEEHPAY